MAALKRDGAWGRVAMINASSAPADCPMRTTFFCNANSKLAACSVSVCTGIWTYRITSEGRDIVLNPLQCEKDILNSLVSINPGAVKCQKADGSKSVVDWHQDCALICNSTAVVNGVRYSSLGIWSTVDPDFYWKLRVLRGFGWGPYIYIKTERINIWILTTAEWIMFVSITEPSASLTSLRCKLHRAEMPFRTGCKM